MPTRNVVITQQQAEMIESLVEAGRYQNASEVLREGLRLVDERQRKEAAKIELLREAVQVGLAQVEAGMYDEIEDADLEDYIDQLASRAASLAHR